MRIVYLHQYFATPSMAGGTRSYELARRLVDRGHEVHMITSRRDASPAQPAHEGWTETVEAGIHVHWYPVPYNNGMSYRRRLLAFAQFARQAGRRASRLPADVVYATSTPLTIAIPGIRAARSQQIPFVFEVRDLWPETPIAIGALKSRFTVGLARRLESWAYGNARHLVALSPGMRDGIRAAGIPENSISVIPNACDFDLFADRHKQAEHFRQSHDWLGNRPMLAYVGTLGRINGVAYMVRLAAEMFPRNPEIRFVAVGTGGEEETVRHLAQRLNVWQKNFFLLPQMKKSEVPAVVNAADLCSSWVVNRPPLWKNSANKVFDAMAAGRGIVINHEGWIADLCRDWDLGLVLDPEDVPGAVDRLTSVIGNRHRVRQMGLAAAEAGRQLFDRDQLADQLESVLSSVAAESGALQDIHRTRRAA